MKVLVYTTLFPNRQEPTRGIFIRERMIHFSRLPGCQIKVISPVPFFPPININSRWFDFSQIPRKEIIDGIEVFHPRYPLLPRVGMTLHGLSLFLSSLSIVKHLRHTFAFDLIDGHYIYPDGFAAVLLAKATRSPVVLSARGSDIHQFIRLTSIKPMLKYALTHAEKVISVSESLKQEMQTLGIPDAKIKVVPNGVDILKFHPDDREHARQSLGIPKNGKIIVSVGKLIPLKGFDILIDAIHRVLKQDSNVYLYIIGEGPLRPILEERIKRLDLAERVFLVGPVPHTDLYQWYNAADMSILASLREGWPNVIMESLACGTPVIATRAGAAPEILTSPKVGRVVQRDKTSLGEALQVALHTSWDRHTIRSHVADRDWFTVASELKHIFSVVVGSYPGTAIPAS